MAIWSDLISRELGELTIEARKRVIRQLTALGREYLVPQVADTVSRAIVKSLDGVVKAAVTSLELEEDAARLATAYLDEVQEQLSQFSIALEGYLPHALAVEVAKERHGSKSAQANEARKVRDTWLKEVRSEVRDVFKSVAGDEASD